MERLKERKAQLITPPNARLGSTVVGTYPDADRADPVSYRCIGAEENHHLGRVSGTGAKSEQRKNQDDAAHPAQGTKPTAHCQVQLISSGRPPRRDTVRPEESVTSARPTVSVFRPIACAMETRT